MRKIARPARHEIAITTPAIVRTVSRALIALTAIGALAACSSNQNITGAAEQHETLTTVSSAPAIVYVSDSSGVDQLWQVANGVSSRISFSNAVDKDPHSAAGHLVFASYRDGDEEIYMGRNDLSRLKRLTVSAGDDEQPNLSPDGTRIAFVSTRSGSPRIWLMDSTGANQTALPTGSESYVPESAPAWSPDGTKIVYTSTRSGMSQVFVIPVGGGTPTQLSHEMNGAFNPVWSADGTQIYFVAVMGVPSLRAVTIATGETSDWVYDGAGIGQPACAAAGCVAVESAYGSNGSIVSIGQNLSTTTIVATPANETSPTILVR
jgi:dipeptidyl aminopeptidase/acylaminoacyl peptidase